MPSAPTRATEEFLSHDGRMGRSIREYDWSQSPLGAISGWPLNLRVALRLLLSSKLPMVLWWGSHRVHFYNDAYMVTLRPERKLKLLGTLGSTRTDAIWAAVGPRIERVMDGLGAEAGLDEPLAMPHVGGHKLVYWDFEFLPIDGLDKVEGVLAVLRDVSADHADDIRLNKETEHLLELFEGSSGFVAVCTGPDHVYAFVNQEYRKLMGDRVYLGRPVRDVVPEVEGQGFFDLLDHVYRTGESYIGRNVPMSYLAPGGSTVRTVRLNFVYKALKAADGSSYGVMTEGTSSLGSSGLVGVLTKREREVLGWVAAGKTANETATILGVSKRTCEMHIYSAARKLDTTNSTQTVVEAISRGELELKPPRH